MVILRMSRGGDKNNPFYKIVAADKRYSRDGRYIEKLGYFNPMARGQEASLNLEIDRVDYWLGVGAKMTERVSQLIKNYRKNILPQVRPPMDEQKKIQIEQSQQQAKAKLQAETKAAEAADADET